MIRTRLLLPLVLAALVLVAAAPIPCLACSCIQSTIADWIGKPDVVIFTGTAGPQVGDEVPVIVSRWYQGPGGSPILMTPVGDGASCGTQLTPGPWIVTANIDPQTGKVIPSLCLPHASLDTADGQQMLDTVVTTLGKGNEPSASPEAGAPSPTPTAEPTSPPSAEPGSPVAQTLVAVGGLALLGALGIGLFVRIRRRPD
jgi:hypothetical protein